LSGLSSSDRTSAAVLSRHSIYNTTAQLAKALKALFESCRQADMAEMIAQRVLLSLAANARRKN
jgi:hypothetical protein